MGRPGEGGAQSRSTTPTWNASGSRYIYGFDSAWFLEGHGDPIADGHAFQQLKPVALGFYFDFRGLLDQNTGEQYDASGSDQILPGLH